MAKTTLLANRLQLEQALIYMIQDASDDDLADWAEGMTGGDCYTSGDQLFAMEVDLTDLPADSAGTLRSN